MEEFVHLENAYMDRCEKQEIAKIRNGQEFKPLVGWFGINEEQGLIRISNDQKYRI